MRPLLLLLAAFPAAAAAEQSFMESCRRFLVPELETVETRLEQLRAERELLPVDFTQPDFSHAGYRSEATAMPGTGKWVQVDLGWSMPVDDIVLLPAVLPSAAGMPVPLGFPLRFTVAVSGVPDFNDQSIVFDSTQHDFPDPVTQPVIIRRPGKTARYVRVTATQLRGEPDNYFFALGELVVCSGNRNVADGARVMALDSFQSPRWSLHGLVDGISVAGRPVEGRMLPTNGYHGREESDAPGLQQWVQVDLGSSRPLEEVRLVPARPMDFPDTIGFGFPVRFKVEAAEDASFREPRLIKDQTQEDFPNPGDRRVILPASGISGRYVRVTATRLWQRNRRPGDVVFALAELEVMVGGRNVALARPVTDSSPLGLNSRWAPAFLVDGVAPREGVGTFADWLAMVAGRQAMEAEVRALDLRSSGLRDRAERKLAWIAGGTAAALFAGIAAVLWAVRLRQRRQTSRLRASIARDLHDEIGSNLSSVGLLSQLGLDSGSDVRAMRSELEEIRRVAAETASSMHDIVWLISPGKKTLGDLTARLRDSANLLLAGMEFTLEADASGTAGRLPLETQRELFLIFKEALHNIRRHAAATRADIRLTQSGSQLTLTIRDDGAGFDPAQVSGGHGLSNMRQRAAACRGKLDIASRPGAGTVITLSIPCR